MSGAVPPEVTDAMVPFEPPKQLTGVGVTEVMDGAARLVTDVFTAVVQLLASVITTA